MHTHRKYLLVLIFSSIQITLVACSCVFIESFCETTTFGSDSTWADLIVYGEKISNQEDGMEVEVLNIFHGVENRSSIFIKRGNGADCGEDTDRFNIGEQFIFALIKGDPRGTDSTSYWLSICGINFLKVEEGAKVVGPITPDLSEIPLSEFHTLPGCGPLTSVNPVNKEHLFRLFPNPTRNTLNLEWDLEGKIEGDLRIFDATGRLLNRWMIDEENQAKLTYDIPHIPAGLYFVEIRAINRREAFKILVQ